MILPDDKRHAAWSRAARRASERAALREELDAIALDGMPGHALTDEDEARVLDAAVWLMTRADDPREAGRVLALLLGVQP